MVIMGRVKFLQRCCLQMPPCIPSYGLSVQRWALSSGRMPSAPAQFCYCYFSPDHLWLWSELIVQGTWELVYHPLSSFFCSLNPFANLPNNIYISCQNYKTRSLMYIDDSIVNKYAVDMVSFCVQEGWRVLYSWAAFKLRIIQEKYRMTLSLLLNCTFILKPPVNPTMKLH